MRKKTDVASASAGPGKEDVRINISIPKGSKMPLDMSTMKMGGKHSVMVHGTVTDMHENDYDRGFALKVHGIDMPGLKEEPGSLTDDMKKAKKARTTPMNDMDEDD